MTNQKTPVQGGATEEQIEAAARALACLEPGEDWPTNGELGGSPTGTRDDEYRDAMRDQALAALEAAAAVSASASAHPAGEHHDAEEREAESEDHAATVTPIMQCSDGLCPMGCSHLMWSCAKCSCEGGWGAERKELEALSATHVCPEPHEATVVGEGPSDAHLARARDAIDRTFGWKHLRKYGRMSEEWMDKLRDGLARNVLAFEEIPAATVTGDREKLALDRVWKAMGCAWNPEAFKAGVRDMMWSQVVEFCEEQTAGNNRLHRENEELRTALAAPVEVDEAKLVKIVRDTIDRRPYTDVTRTAIHGLENAIGRELSHRRKEWSRGDKHA